MIKVFIGTDRSQWLATHVLSHSLKTTTSHDISIEPLDKITIPEPLDVRQSQRTGFSFARWAIPELCSYKGKAIYLDADMLVFSDISQLWEIVMEDKVISIVDGTNGQYCSKGVKLNKNETSVMVVNCEKADWTLQKLVHGLDGTYTYKEMMSDLCFLDNSKIDRTISRCWNSMDYWDETSNLVHFTNVPTQPWVSLDNPFGYVWVDYLKSMIKSGAVNLDAIKNEIDLGYIRPSLMKELEEKTALIANQNYIDILKQIDTQAGYIPHREVIVWNARRDKVIRDYERKLARNNGLRHYAEFELKNFINKTINKMRSWRRKF